MNTRDFPNSFWFHKLETRNANSFFIYLLYILFTHFVGLYSAVAFFTVDLIASYYFYRKKYDVENRRYK